jgi:hypothetical protein
MRQIAENRTRKINRQITAASRKHLEWLRVDLLEVWAAPCFDVDAYARIRGQIRLIIDTVRQANDPLSRAVLSSSRRRKTRRRRQSALLTSSSIAEAEERYRASSTRMKLMPALDPAPRNSSPAP